MSDVELRALERLAKRGGAAARLRLAACLERLGRVDDVHDVLLLERDDARVRQALARFPAWRESGGDGGRTRFVDVPPLASPPRLRFLSAHTFPLLLLASPLGIVTRRRREIVVLDPESGELRHEFPDTGLGVIAGEVLYTASSVASRGRSHLDGWDLWTGAHLHSTDLASARVHHDLAFAGKHIVLTRTRGPSDGIVVFSVDPDRPTRPPELRWERRRRALFPGMAKDHGTTVVTDDVVVQHAEFTGGPFVGLDLATGSELFRGVALDDVVADKHGAVGVLTSRRIVALDRGGTRRALSRRRASPCVLTPQLVLASGRFGHVAISRSTDESWTISCRRTSTLAAAARDVVFFHEDQLVFAADLRGKPLWHVELPERVWELAPLARRLYGRTESGRVFCLEAGEE